MMREIFRELLCRLPGRPFLLREGFPPPSPSSCPYPTSTKCLLDSVRLCRVVARSSFLGVCWAAHGLVALTNLGCTRSPTSRPPPRRGHLCSCSGTLVLVCVCVCVCVHACPILGVANILCCCSSSRWFAISIATLLIDMASMQKERERNLPRECE